MGDRDGDDDVRRGGDNVQRTQRDSSLSRILCSGGGWRGHGSCSGRLASGEFNSELVADDDDELHDAEQEDEEQGKAQRQLNGSLASITVGPALTACR